jgi:hypothetical protein
MRKTPSTAVVRMRHNKPVVVLADRFKVFEPAHVGRTDFLSECCPSDADCRCGIADLKSRSTLHTRVARESQCHPNEGQRGDLCYAMHVDSYDSAKNRAIFLNLS